MFTDIELTDKLTRSMNTVAEVNEHGCRAMAGKLALELDNSVLVLLISNCSIIRLILYIPWLNHTLNKLLCTALGFLKF